MLSKEFTVTNLYSDPALIKVLNRSLGTNRQNPYQITELEPDNINYEKVRNRRETVLSKELTVTNLYFDPALIKVLKRSLGTNRQNPYQIAELEPDNINYKKVRIRRETVLSKAFTVTNLYSNPALIKV